jgi:hypothetical protein
MDVSPMGLTNILPIFPWSEEHAKSDLDTAINTIIPKSSPGRETFFFVFLDSNLQPPQHMKSRAEKFAYCQVLHSYLSHHLTPREAKSFNFDSESPACNGHYVYLVAKSLWRCKAPNRVQFTAKRAPSDTGRVAREKEQMELGLARFGSAQWTHTSSALRAVRESSLAAVKDNVEVAWCGQVKITDFWQSVRTCEKIAKDEDKFDIGRKVFGRKVYGLMELKENTLLREAETATVEPDDGNGEM